MKRQRTHQEPKKILIIDCSRERQRVLEIVLRRYQCEILTASEAHEGLSRLADTPGIALVLIDVNMSALREIDLFERLTEQAAADRIPIITLSGISVAAAAGKILALAQGNIKKPYTSTELHAVIQPFFSDIIFAAA